MTSTTSTTQDIPAMLANMSAASLFVGELLPHVNEVILYKKFAPMGTVTSVKLCRDWVTGKSLCYAYVNFENPAEAEKAYRSLNYELLEGHPMRIMKSTRNPWLQKDGDCSCYHHHCCGSGTKGFIDAKTFVEAIENYSAAFKNLAIQDCGEVKAPTGYKYSSEFLKRMNIANNRFTNVFIKNFKDLLDDFKLWKLCKQFGEVTSAKVMVDEYGISKGFGFASFTDSDAAQRAVNKLNGLVLDGRTLYAGPAITKTQRQRDGSVRYDNDDHKTEWRHNSLNTSTSPRIRIRNLRDVVDEVRLRKEFERFGPVTQTELLKTCDGRSKGTGYVVYQDQQDATKAVVSMHGKVIYGTRISVTYAPFNTTPTATNTAPVKSPTPTTNNNTTSVSGGGNNSSNTTNDGDNNGNKNFLQFKDLVSTLANKGHPVNINDITTFNSNSVNRNSSNNTENINISNNAILARSTRKVADVTEATENGDVDNGNDLKQAEEDSGDDMTSTSATLSVKNLDESISDEKLESLFSVYGHVLSAKVISNEFGVSKGFGFVIMSDAQDAVRAIKNLDGRIVVNRPIYVAPTVHARLLTKL